MKQKHYFYVGVQNHDGRVRLVTALDHQYQQAEWRSDAKPLAMSKALAEDIAFGLCMNLTVAFIVTSLFPLDEQIGGDAE